MEMNRDEISVAINKLRESDIDEIMKDFYPEPESSPSQELPNQIVRMFMLIIRTANAFAIERKEAMELIRLTIELSKVDDNRYSLHEIWDVLNDISGHLRGIGIDTMNMVDSRTGSK